MNGYNKRTLVTVKWSLRADREKQFGPDYDDYERAESGGEPFEYVFVTNEFDPARLMRACEARVRTSSLFSHVVHINTDALKATYGESLEPSIAKVRGHISSGRLLSLQRWLELLAAS